MDVQMSFWTLKHRSSPLGLGPQLGVNISVLLGPGRSISLMEVFQRRGFTVGSKQA